jgi:UDP-N-acetylmuramyl pentapeptide phosphotransferase/UDP-N-acetylglucosamine-1-phosphate transferase
MFVIIAIINAFNLIDGVNGLAGTVALLVSIVFGFLFYKVDRIELAIVAFSMAGSIVAFLKYNYTPAKIFMGDTGSLLLGLVSAVLAIKFFEINKEQANPLLIIESGPVFAISVLIIPIFDTIRVMILRTIRGKSPFHPDRNHIHHLLLDIGFSHMQVTFVLVYINMLFIYIAYEFRRIDNNILFLAIIVIALTLTSILALLVKRKKKQVV